MKQILTILLILASLQGFAQQNDPAQNQPDLKNLNDSLNFFLGVNLGYNLGTAPWNPDAKLIIAGLTSVLEGHPTHDQQTGQQIFQQLNMTLAQAQQGQSSADGAANLEKGRAFLAENGQREGVITTESGLQYEVIVQGEGEKPNAASSVEVHYEGMLLDGTVFDSSYERGESITFPLNRVVQGWTEGLQLMPVGSTYRFYIPAELAYGSRATGKIPAQSTLIFKVELLGIK